MKLRKRKYPEGERELGENSEKVTRGRNISRRISYNRKEVSKKLQKNTKNKKY